MEVLEVAEKMEHLITSMSRMRAEIKNRAKARAETISNYERQISVTIIKLKNGVRFEVDGEEIQNPPVTIIEKIAKGICYESKLDMELAEGEYKSLITNIETVKAELNGLQSINRHLE